MSAYYSIDLNKNGRFDFKYHDCINTNSLDGTWRLENGRLLFSNKEIRPLLIEVIEIQGFENDSLQIHVVDRNNEDVYLAFVQIDDSLNGYTNDSGRISFKTSRYNKLSTSFIHGDTGVFYSTTKTTKSLEIKLNTAFYGNLFYFENTQMHFKRNKLYLPVNNSEVKLYLKKHRDNT